MDPDLFFVIGMIIVAFSIPSMLSAFSEGRPPRVAMGMIVLGGGLLAFAVSQHPNGYAIADIPDAFVRVVGRYLN